MVRVDAVVPAFGDDPWLERCIDALLGSRGVDIAVVVVDNGADPAAIGRVADRPGVVVVRPGGNLGYAGGCDAGAAAGDGDVLVFVNQDAIVEPEALSLLADVAERPGVGIATGSVRLAGDPARLNSGGNDVHFLGFSWAGRYGEIARAGEAERDVIAASGTALAITRELWKSLGGFDPRYFAYHEDTELSLRCWQRGLRVVYVPDAIVLHRYEFSRNRQKQYLLERNRLVVVLTLFERRTLIVLAPMLLAAEVAIVVLAAREGWVGQKLAGWGWLVRNARWLRARRRRLQRERTVPDGVLGERFAIELRPGNLALPRGARWFDRLAARYWARVLPRLRRP
ncbi:MAG: glycosyltransferase family 2 protein [Acidimicrobiia bacterium]|nr:glycosyltransferase family 2 protein [Acidimicrobiia bacterium]